MKFLQLFGVCFARHESSAVLSSYFVIPLFACEKTLITASKRRSLGRFLSLFFFLIMKSADTHCCTLLLVKEKYQSIFLFLSLGIA